MEVLEASEQIIEPLALSNGIKIMTYNIHYGSGVLEYNSFDIERTAAVILASGAEVISLNEVDKNYDARSSYIDEPAYLVDYMTTHTGTQWYGKFQKTTWKAPTAASGNKPREFGHMVLSKFPIDSSRMLLYTAHDVAHYSGILETRINVNGNSFHFYSTHLATETDKQPAQIQEILDFTGIRPGPKIIAGDMNFIPTDPQHAQMTAVYNDPSGTSLQPYTFKSTAPSLRLDYFWGSSQVQFSNVANIQTHVSDHLPLVADVILDYSVLTLMQYDINHGVGTGTYNNYNLQRIADVIKNADPDIVVLNEVDRNYDVRSNYDDQMVLLASQLKMYYEFQKTTYKAAIPASFNKERQFGHGVLSKYPIGPASTQGRWIYTDYGTHFNGLLKVRIDVSGNPMYLYVTNLGTDAADRLSQANEAVGFINPPNYTWKVLAGNINDTPGTPAVNSILTILSDAFSGQQAFTYPSNLPAKRVDYIFAKSTIQISDTSVIPSQASTHLPIVSKLKLLEL